MPMRIINCFVTIACCLTAALAGSADAVAKTRVLAVPPHVPPSRGDGSAGMTFEAHCSMSGEYLACVNSPVVVVKLLEVRGNPGTNGSPPRVTVEIQQVLRGKLTLGSHEAVMSGPDSGVDWVGSDAEKELAKWSSCRTGKPNSLPRP